MQKEISRPPILHARVPFARYATVTPFTAYLRMNHFREIAWKEFPLSTMRHDLSTFLSCLTVFNWRR